MDKMIGTIAVIGALFIYAYIGDTERQDYLDANPTTQVDCEKKYEYWTDSDNPLERDTGRKFITKCVDDAVDSAK